LSDHPSFRESSGGSTRPTGSLDVYRQIPPKSSSNLKSSHKRKFWSRRQKRIFQRSMSLLTFWDAYDYQVNWVTLTTASDGDADLLNVHFTILKKRIERTFGFLGIQHFIVKTDEGNGVYHLYLAWKARKGMRRKSFFIPYDWLKENWFDIHGAFEVRIRRVRKGRQSRERLSAYNVSHYCANQELIVRTSWSWKLALGGALAKTWDKLKQILKNKKLCIKVWNNVLRGMTVTLEGAKGEQLYKVKPPPHLSIECPLMTEILSQSALPTFDRRWGAFNDHRTLAEIRKHLSTTDVEHRASDAR